MKELRREIKTAKESEISGGTGTWLDTIRFNDDREERSKALEQLRQYFGTVTITFEEPRSFIQSVESDEATQALLKIIRYSKDKGDKKMALKLLVDRDLVETI